MSDVAKEPKTLRRPVLVGKWTVEFFDMPICKCDDPKQSISGICQNCDKAIPFQDGS